MEEHRLNDTSSVNSDGADGGDWGQEGRKRETWPGRCDFILSCVGYSVGLGNFWRFPYLCYKNGGGAFLVPYIICLLACGLPLTILEMNLGQFVSLGPAALFHKFCPLFQGLGWTQMIITCMSNTYYNMIIGWTIYYIYLSISVGLPWTTCGNSWNTEFCVSAMADLNKTGSANATKTASEEFWKRYVLDISPGIEHLGGINWPLFFCFAIAWVIIFCCVFKGVKSSGRVIYVTATFPYLGMTILLIQAVTFPGAVKGLQFYFVPEWGKLADVNVWIAAASQIFYSVGFGWGGLITFASYNRFNHNSYRDALLMPIISCGTSLFAGIVVFSILGYMAEESGLEIDDVVASGPGLAFIVYPEALATFPFAPVWTVLFFLMLLTIGVDTQFGGIETVVSALVDSWPTALRRHRTALTALVCLLTFILGLPCTTRGGMYVLQLMDWYSAAFSLMLAGAIECLLLTYNYGSGRFEADITLMVGYRPHPCWPIFWGFVTPGIVLSVLVATLITHAPVEYGNYQYPTWAAVIGWLLAGVSILPIPLYAAYNLFWVRAGMPWMERLSDAMRPMPDWGPSRLGDRIAYRKSLNVVPGRQLFVLGAERVETEMVDVDVEGEHLSTSIHEAQHL